MATNSTTTWITMGVLLAFAIGCESRALEDPPPPIKPPAYPFPQTFENDVDILFVIDNSAGMAQAQENLRHNFGALIDALKSDKLDGKFPNVHIGVITTDLGAGNGISAIPSCETAGGDRGALQSKARLPGCPAPTDGWISYTEGVTNIEGCADPDPIECVKESFGCIAALGIEGCDFEMPLESARRALDPELNLNPGFLRHGARLAVVFITDEDDCSARNPQLFDPTQQGLNDPLGPLTSFRCFEFGMQCDINDRNIPGPRQNCVPAYDWLHDVDDYITFFEQIKGSKDRVIMAAIAGPSSPVQVGHDGPNPALLPSCQTATGHAAPAIRIAKVVEAFEGQLHSLCAETFGPALEKLGEKIVASLGGQCITSPLLIPNGGVACRAGVGPCKMPSCPEGMTCDAERGVCIDGAGSDTADLCGESCLDKADCQLILITDRGTPQETETLVQKCPRPLFDPSLAKEECGDHCPCWRIVPRVEDCPQERGVSPFSFDIMRTEQAPRGSVVLARCRTARFRWTDDEVQNAPVHCAAP